MHPTSATDGTCVACPTATYWKEDRCQNCPVLNCRTCGGDKGECYACLGVYQLVDGVCVRPTAQKQHKSVRNDECAHGEFFDGISCAPCEDGCSRCHDLTGKCWEQESDSVDVANLSTWLYVIAFIAVIAAVILLLKALVIKPKNSNAAAQGK